MSRETTQFKPGQSGNPRGRPKGKQDKRVVLRALLEPHAEDLVKKAVELAKEGDTTALRLCLERIIPAYKSQDLSVSIGALKGTLTKQGQTILQAMGIGSLPASEASAMLQALAAQARITESEELTKRLDQIKQHLIQRGVMNEPKK